MNNAPYGKTIENVARRTDIRLLNDKDKVRKLAQKPHSSTSECSMDMWHRRTSRSRLRPQKSCNNRRRWLGLRCESSITSSTSHSPTAFAYENTAN